MLHMLIANWFDGHNIGSDSALYSNSFAAFALSVQVLKYDGIGSPRPVQVCMWDLLLPDGYLDPLVQEVLVQRGSKGRFPTCLQ